VLKILALDTSTPRAAVAVATADGLVRVATPDPDQRHGRTLVPTIRDLLRAAGLAPRDLDFLAAGLGPGSYTGLRIGLTAAKTLAYVTGRPLVGLDSLELLARNAPGEALRVAVIADAQRGDLYAADFARSEPGGPLLRTLPTRIEPIDRWIERLEPATVVLGPGLERLRTPLPGSVLRLDPPADRPDGPRLIELARDTWATDRRDDPWFLEPLYLRRSAAEDQWEGRKGTDGPARSTC
jgi:tRNA threonylcarbamoyladenosine biosynthesis protein TsaB